MASSFPLPLVFLILLASTAIHAFSVNFSKLNPFAPQNDMLPSSSSSTNDTKEALKSPAAPLSSIGIPSTPSVANSNAEMDSASSRNQRKRSCCCCNCCCCKCCPCCCCCPCQCGESCWKWTPCCCCPCCCGCVGYGRRKMMRCRRNSTTATNFMPATECPIIPMQNGMGFISNGQNHPANIKNPPGKRNE